MQFSDCLISDHRRRSRFPRRFRCVLLAGGLILLAVMLVMSVTRRRRKSRREPLPADVAAAEPAGPPLLYFTFPTAQTNLADMTSTVVYMPTASGRVESAWYGSTRTAGASGNYLPRFHAGIDIAPLQRDRNGKPLDAIRAVAAGRVAYVQRAASGSSYGRYIVLHHADPVGTVYSLYAHLESIAPGIKTGAAVEAGKTIGRMGHSSSIRIPVQRAHLHFEVGVFLHARFGDWLHARGLPRTHGVGHGWNLQALDPLSVLLERDASGKRAILTVLQQEPPAFTLLLDLDERPDYYRRHPTLWEIEVDPPLRVRIEVAEGGAPLRARAALPGDASLDGLPRVVDVAPEVLGRNGRRLVVESQGEWRIGQAGERWLSKLLFP